MERRYATLVATLLETKLVLPDLCCGNREFFCLRDRRFNLRRRRESGLDEDTGNVCYSDET